MLGSSHLIFVALLTVFFLKKRYYRHHWSSILIIVSGIVLVGYSYLIRDQSADDHSVDDVIIGIIVL